MRSTNVFGRAQLLMVLTPIEPGEEEALRAYLEGLRDDGPSPLARNRRTHVARFVVVPDLPHDPAARADHLDLQYLLFTSAYDGDRESYLDELLAQLEPEAREIWGRCVGCPPRGGASLKAYLKHNQLDAGLFFAAYPDASVDDVERALDQRERLIGFMLRGQGLAPAELQRAFVAEFAP
jgi:hypothetical protein